jgi:arabinofuranosyltransferase
MAILRFITNDYFYYTLLLLCFGLIARAAYESFFKSKPAEVKTGTAFLLAGILSVFILDLFTFNAARLTVEFIACSIYLYVLIKNGLFRRRNIYLALSVIFLIAYAVTAVYMALHFKPFNIAASFTDEQSLVLYFCMLAAGLADTGIKTLFALLAVEIVFKEADDPRYDAKIWIPAAVMAVILYFLVVLRTAWVCDDAFITFRTASNLVSGIGPLWNAGERVMAYTNVLWMFVFAFFHAFTGEAYFTSIALCVVVDILVITLVYGFIKDKFVLALAVIAMIFSRAFIDYSTSGLENPMSSLILAAAVIWVLRNSEVKAQAVLLFCSIAFLNRMDTVLFLVPLAFYSIYLLFFREEGNFFKKAGMVIIMLSPAVLWVLFSTIYYGFPFPNTFYAKQMLDLPRTFFMYNGLEYYMDSFKGDPVTLSVIASGLIMPFLVKNENNVVLRLLSSGTGIFLLYILYIGGDFMSGRLFTPAFIVSLLILSYYVMKTGAKIKIMALTALVYIGSMSFYLPVISGKDVRLAGITPYGIADERGYYYQDSGLLRNLSMFRKDPVHFKFHEIELKRTVQPGKTANVSIREAIGCAGYFSGPNAHIVDILALSDAFLARMRMDGKSYRIGHLSRIIPKGYVESLEYGKNLIKDPALAEYYDHLSVVIKGKIFSRERFQEIININAGKYDYLLKGEAKK